MGKLRSILVLVSAFALVWIACGDVEEPQGSGGTGGSGAVGGSGGDGGTGGDDNPSGPPEVFGFEPEKGGPGFRIRVLGKNLSAGAPKNTLFFVAKEGSTQPNLEAKGLSADPEGTWFETDVPMNAKSGPTLITVDTPDGLYSVKGPDFVVTDDRLPPVLTRLTPSVITAEERAVKVTGSGSGFYPNITTLKLNGEDFPIDWSQSSMTQVVFTIPAEMAKQPATHDVQLHTPPPAGGESIVQKLKVVEPINLLSATGKAQRAVRLEFDQPVSGAAVSAKGAIRIKGVRRGGVSHANTVWGQPTLVDLELSFNLDEGKSYTVEVDSNFTSAEGGAIVKREASFTFSP